MDLDIFVIFHKTLYWDMYKDLDPDEFECLKFVAVNENVPKEWDQQFSKVTATSFLSHSTQPASDEMCASFDNKPFAANVISTAPSY